MLFGFGSDQLYVRVDGARAMAELLAEGREVSLTFLTPAGLRFTVRQTGGRPTGVFAAEASPGAGWLEAGPRGASFAVGRILELALPLAGLGVAGGNAIAFFVALARGGAESERHPADTPIRATAPDGAFAARQWSA